MELAATPIETENRLREKRHAIGLSQRQLAELAGITRQAVCALEANQYVPATSVALRLARALGCRVEDLFSLKSGEEIVEGDLLGELPQEPRPVRARVAQVGHRLLIRPLIGNGEWASLSYCADGLVIGADPTKNRVKLKLLKDSSALGRTVVMGGCDPAMFLASEYVRRFNENMTPFLMGSSSALDALKRGEVHVAGIHLANENGGLFEPPDLKEALGDMDCVVITFAHWEEGFMVRRGNPKKIRNVNDIAKPTVKIVNRENGSGARRLLDRQLKVGRLRPDRIRGYSDEVFSHVDVAWRVKTGLADAGIGVRAVADVWGLDFVPLQRERYDWVIPRAYYETLPGLKALLDTIVTKPFREELEALGGYDTRDTGKIVPLI